MRIATALPRRPLKSLTTTLLATVVLILILFLLAFWNFMQDPQGESTDACTTEEQLPVWNISRSMVVTSHETVCNGFGGNMAFYVYIHKSTEQESSQTLVFRYSEIPSAEPPQIRWPNENAVNIEVREVGRISKQLDQIDGVKINYTVGKIDYPN
jgi:hypothetical protein